MKRRPNYDRIHELERALGFDLTTKPGPPAPKRGWWQTWRTTSRLAKVAVVAGVAVIVSSSSILLSSNSTSGGGGGGACTGVPCAAPIPATLNNEWVNTSAGASPSRCSSPCAYDSTHAYGSFQAAYAAASHGDAVGVQCGSYGDQHLTSDIAGSGTQVTFQPVTNWCATAQLNYDTSSASGDYATWTGFNFGDLGNGAISMGCNPCSNHNVYFFHNHVVMLGKTSTSDITVHSCLACKFDWNTIGPSVPSSTTGSTPAGMSIGVLVGQPESQLEVRGNVIQSTIRNPLDWPSTYFTVENTTPISAGSLPSGAADCEDPYCHADGIHGWGLTDTTFSQNWVLNVGVQGIFLEDTNGGVLRNINFVNNFVSPNQGVDSSNTGISIDCRATSATCTGTWNFDFNTARRIEILDATGGSFGTTTMNLVGNIAQQYMHGSSGSNGCNVFNDYPSFSATYAYNVWSDGGRGALTCGTGDTIATPALVDFPFDLHLTGPAGAADNLVPPGVCTPITTLDADGQTRPMNTNCDAGADERAVS